MPVYEYECRACGKRHEAVQGMSDPPLTVCPACDGALYRIISPSGLSFKGQGWYITDYARKGKETSGKAVSDKKEALSPTPATDKKENATPAVSVTPEKKDSSPPEKK